MVGHRWVVGWVVLASVGCVQTPRGDEGGDDSSSSPEPTSSEDTSTSNDGSSSSGASSSEDDSSSSDGSSSGGEPVECDGLDEATCSANPACRTASCVAMQERPETEAGWCSEGSVFTHCMTADAICPAMEMGICSGDTFYMCTSGCVPSGPEWFECDTSAPIDAPACG